MYERFKGIISKRIDLDEKSETNGFVQGLAMSGASGLSKFIACLIAYPHEVSFYFSFARGTRLTLGRLSGQGYDRLRWRTVARNIPVSSNVLG
jgi:hypothetical protein